MISDRQSRSQPPSLRRIGIALLVCGAAFLALLTQRDALLEHKLWFTEDRKDVSFNFEELSEDWTEGTLRERFAELPIHCEANPGQGLGDMACAVDTKSHNGLPALFVSFFFSAGHLQQVSVNVPWWKHDEGYRRIESSYGKPTASQFLPRAGVRLHGWKLPNGSAIFYNRDKSLNPLEWNAIFWRSAAACASDGCFRS